jgi:anti-sigma-K factor RskA
LIEDHGSVTLRILTSYDPGVVERATFGVSLEPEGGSPTGRPTGPVFHAKLIQTVPTGARSAHDAHAQGLD